MTALLFCTAHTHAAPYFPKSFDVGNNKAVFADFQSAKYNITVDVKRQMVSVVSEIEFQTVERGQPVFDLITEPSSVVIDGHSSTAPRVQIPGSNENVRTINEITEVGPHKLIITHQLADAGWSTTGVALGFFMSDYRDTTKFLEPYLPTSFEWDPYKMTIRTEVINSTTEHKLITNGSIQSIGTNSWLVEYPEYFTTSSLYFHLRELATLDIESFDITTSSGKVIPTIVYARKSDGVNLKSYKSRTIADIARLEKDFGPWPHNSLTVYVAGDDGMEYAGAAIVTPNTLLHELTHSYFGRGVMPLNGRSGWIDEAIASWYSGVPRVPRSIPNSPGVGNLANFDEYQRGTWGDGYGHGARLVAYLNFRAGNEAKFIPCLAEMVKNYLYAQINTTKFQKHIELCTGLDLKQDFQTSAWNNQAIPSEPELRKQHTIINQ